MFTIRNFETKTLSWWFQQKKNIDFDPPYQRKGRLWSEKDKSFLIDSILNGFDIPKIYIADFTFVNTSLNRHKKLYAVIDGKQRFEAIFDFFEGRFTLDSEFVFYEEPDVNVAGLSYFDLKKQYPTISSKFENFNLSVISVITDEESKINEMFVRLNKSKALTGAELRNAMEGVVPELTRRIITNPFFNQKIRFNTNRGQDSNLASKLLLIEFRGKFVDTKKVHLDRFVKEAIDAESSYFESAYENIIDVLDLMSEAFMDKDKLLSSSGIIPVYYWLFKQHRKDADLMREYLVNFNDRKNYMLKNAHTNEEIIDYDYVKFAALSKSLNDQNSLQGCYLILKNKLTEFRNNKA